MTTRDGNVIVRMVYRNATARYGMNDGRHEQKGEKAKRKIPFSTLRLSEAVEKPFDKLRVNGGGLRNVEDFPFVLSLSKHEYAG
jgi:hypothetical protein